MSLEGLVTDSLNLPGVQTLRHVSSNGQHTFESISTDPVGPDCCATRALNGTKRITFIDTPREGKPAISQGVCPCVILRFPPPFWRREHP